MDLESVFLSRQNPWENAFKAYHDATVLPLQVQNAKASAELANLSMWLQQARNAREEAKTAAEINNIPALFSFSQVFYFGDKDSA